MVASRRPGTFPARSCSAARRRPGRSSTTPRGARPARPRTPTIRRSSRSRTYRSPASSRCG
ncbi:hypothetical protein XW59_012515 [Aquamicrobium sp. LC103]|nr:hypothetical protein XW59_012515 [Aquamicrobium sp. LC103]